MEYKLKYEIGTWVLILFNDMCMNLPIQADFKFSSLKIILNEKNKTKYEYNFHAAYHFSRN